LQRSTNKGRLSIGKISEIMRIGIDATALPNQPVGAGNYTIHLVRALTGLKREDELVVFSQPHGIILIEKGGKLPVEWILCPELSPGLRLVWEQTHLVTLAKKVRVDLLHSPHYTRPDNLPCRSVVTFHDMTFFLYPELHTRAKRLFFPWAMRRSGKTADVLIADSESTRADMVRLLGIDPNKIIPIPLGVDPGFIAISDLTLRDQIQKKYSLPEEFILFVGTVEPRKNLPLLIQSYQQLVVTGIQIPLVIAGKLGWMYEEVFAQIEANKLNNKVRLIGYVDQIDLPVIYSMAKVFVYPTLYEGFGLPVLEAMACGVPVVTSNVSSLPEIVAEAGLLVPPNDPQALAQAIQKILDDNALSLKLRQAGPQRAAHFSWQRTAQLTLRAYQQALL
jgi:glycosyltransferase involved in cell wall biosynthesis